MTAAPQSAASELRIVLVEDSAMLRAMLRDMLDELDGVGVVAEAEDEPGALAAIEQFRPDLTIIDLELRKGNGMGVLRHLQAEPERFGRPRAVVFSNYGHDPVRSRCQQLTLPPPARAVAEEWLSAHGVDGAGVLLAASGGQPLDALRWHREGLGAAAWAALPRRLADGDPGVFAGWPVPRALDALSKLCHDAMRRAAGGLPTFFAANDVPKGASIESLTAWQRELQRVQRHAEHPWNEPLLVDSLTAGARAVLARRPDDKAFDTLAR